MDEHSSDASIFGSCGRLEFLKGSLVVCRRKGFFFLLNSSEVLENSLYIRSSFFVVLDRYFVCFLVRISSFIYKLSWRMSSGEGLSSGKRSGVAHLGSSFKVL